MVTDIGSLLPCFVSLTVGFLAVAAGKGVVNRIITELCVLDVIPGKGLALVELAEGVELSEVLAKTACKLIVPDKIPRF
jgi:acyl CoA:acetate/3-ketoacid CoA transferase beta subunit